MYVCIVYAPCKHLVPVGVRMRLYMPWISYLHSWT